MSISMTVTKQTSNGNSAELFFWSDKNINVTEFEPKQQGMIVQLSFNQTDKNDSLRSYIFCQWNDRIS